MTNNIGQAMYEVNIILENTSDDIVKLIPEKILKIIKEKSKAETPFVFNKEESLENQNITDSTRGVLALLYRDYICSEDQKEKYNEYYKKATEELEKKKAEEFKVEDIFKKKNQYQTEDTALIPYKKETIWNKIKNIILGLFNKQE